MRKKEITMSINEFLDYTEKNKLERLAYQLLNNKNFKTFIIFSLAVALILIDKQVAYATTPDLSGIDKMGRTFLGIIQHGGYWITLVMGLIDVIKQVPRGGDGFGNIGKIIAKYILIFASLYFMPYMFDIVKDCFR